MGNQNYYKLVANNKLSIDAKLLLMHLLAISYHDGSRYITPCDLLLSIATGLEVENIHSKMNELERNRVLFRYYETHENKDTQETTTFRIIHLLENE